MGTDFFDGLVKTFSKTTKELGKTTRELGARAEQTIEAQKIRSKITGEERIIEKIKVDIGDIVYRRHSQGDGIDSELSALCQEIDQHYLKIREYKDNAANLKGEKIWKELLEYIRTENKQVYRKLRHSLFGRVMNLPGRGGRKMSVAAYKISQKFYGFN